MNRFKVIMAGIIKSIIFGVGFLMTAKSIEQIPVVDFLALRFLVAAICFEILRLTVLKFKLNLKDIIRLLPMALCIPIGYYTFETIGLQGASSMSAGIIVSFVPALTFIFEIIFLKERCSLKRGGFILLSVLGVLLIAYMSGGTDKQNTLWGIGFLLLASSMESLYAITSKKASERLGAPERTYVMMWVGAVVFNAVNIVEKLATGTISTYFSPFFDRGSLLCILYMGIVPLIIAFFLYNYMLEREKTSVVTVYIGLETVVAVIAGVLFNEEVLYLYHIIGAILIFAGIIGVNKLEINSQKGII